MWTWLSIGVAVITLALTFGLTARKAFKRIGKLEKENESLNEKLKISEGRVRRATAPRPTIDELLNVSTRMSQLRPEDN
jgi:hypothetical protein